VVYLEMLSVVHWFNSYGENSCVMEWGQMGGIYNVWGFDESEDSHCSFWFL